MNQAVSVTSMASRVAGRVVACCATSSHAHASTHTQAHVPPTPSRNITTKTKSRGPASPLLERGQDGGLQHIVEAECQNLSLPEALGPAYIFQHAAKWSHKTALECFMSGRSYTYGQLVDGVMRFGGYLQRIMGVKHQQEETDGHPTVAILSPNIPEYPIAFFGVMSAGATVTPMNPSYTPGEIAHHIRDSGASVVVVAGQLTSLATAALQLVPREVKVVVIGPSDTTHPNLMDIIADPNIPFIRKLDVSVDSTAALPYSSGTTGKPKGVCISHRAFCSSFPIFHHPSVSNMTSAEGDNQESLVALLPFFHIYGMMVLMASGLYHGAKLLPMPKFDPKIFLTTLQNHKVSRLHLVPPLLNFLATSPAVQPSALSNLHSVMIGAAPVPITSANLFKEKVKRPIFFQEGFGMTETLCTHLTPLGQERLGWCGKVMPHVRAKLVDPDTGHTLPPGQKGEMCIDTPGMMTSYHNNPEATKESFDSDGWFKTGDIAVYDEEGFFSIVDRMKELIKVKGLQVSPSELEEVLLSHPGVAEAGVVGVPHDKHGEVPRAYVVPQIPNLRLEDVMEYVSSRVAPHKQLAGGVEVVKELPKNQTGKILRKELKRMAIGE